jgi:hypothetical protein
MGGLLILKYRSPSFVLVWEPDCIFFLPLDLAMTSSTSSFQCVCVLQSRRHCKGHYAGLLHVLAVLERQAAVLC